MLNILVCSESYPYKVTVIDDEAPEQEGDDGAQDHYSYKPLILLLEIAEDDEPVSSIPFPIWVLKLNFHKLIAFY